LNQLGSFLERTTLVLGHLPDDFLIREYACANEGQKLVVGHAVDRLTHRKISLVGLLHPVAAL
jgi:hypothetical protein